MRKLFIAAIVMGTTLSSAQAPVGKIVRLDPALDALIPQNAQLQKVRGGFRFIEGPLWVKSGNYLLFSDLMQNCIFKWTPGGLEGNVEVYRKNVYTGTYPDAVMIGTNGLAGVRADACLL